MSDRMNVEATLEQEFKQFNNTKIIDSMKALQPDDQVAILDAVMRRGGLGGRPIRHVPIIKPSSAKQPKMGELKALISKLDVATLLSPPWELIPKDVVDQGVIDIGSLAEDIRRVSRQTIQEAFQELFSGKPPEISYKQKLYEAMELLTDTYGFNAEGGAKTRRYKTVPVFNEQHSLIGMLSYMDILREIKERDEGHASFLKKTVRQFLKEIEQQVEDIETIESDSSIFNATSFFERVSFTHLPVTTSNVVTGIIDDVIVNTYEHQALISAFSTVPLAKLATPIDFDKNVVSLSASLADVINKFLLDERPTAVLVGELKSEKFQMHGIISYLDILRNFKKTFLSSGNDSQASTQKQGDE